MKILLSSDLHLRYGTPVSRRDKIFVTQLAKMGYLVNLYTEQDCGLWLQAGDFFDAPRLPNILIATYIRLLKGVGFGTTEIPIHCVLGQHDLLMHNLGSMSRSVVDIFRSAGVVEILNSNPRAVGDVLIYGASWGQDVPSPRTGKRSILVLHKMIGTEPLYPGHDPIKPKAFANNHGGYELILCGDYHYRFEARSKNTLIVNTGCLTRQSCSERDKALQPAAAVYDTTTKEIRWFDISVEPPEKVFYAAAEATDEGVSVREAVAMFVEKLRAQSGICVSLRDNLEQYFELNDTPKLVRQKIGQVLEEVSCEN